MVEWGNGDAKRDDKMVIRWWYKKMNEGLGILETQNEGENGDDKQEFGKSKKR